MILVINLSLSTAHQQNPITFAVASFSTVAGLLAEGGTVSSLLKVSLNMPRAANYRVGEWSEPGVEQLVINKLNNSNRTFFMNQMKLLG